MVSSKLPTGHMNVEPIPVVDVTESLPNVAAEFGSVSNFILPQVGVAGPVQILPRRPVRTKAYIYVGTLVLTQVVAGGFASNQIALGTSGTANFNNNSIGVEQTVQGGTVSAIAVNGVTTGFTSGQFFVPAGGTITITYTGAPTTYFTTVPLGQSQILSTAQGVVLAVRPDYLVAQATPLGPAGATAFNIPGFQVLSAPFQLQWESQQPCYAACLGGSGIGISVIDMSTVAVNAMTEEKEEAEGWEEVQEGGNEYESESGNRY